MKLGAEWRYLPESRRTLFYDLGLFGSYGDANRIAWDVAGV